MKRMNALNGVLGLGVLALVASACGESSLGTGVGAGGGATGSGASGVGTGAGGGSDTCVCPASYPSGPTWPSCCTEGQLCKYPSVTSCADPSFVASLMCLSGQWAPSRDSCPVQAVDAGTDAGSCACPATVPQADVPACADPPTCTYPEWYPCGSGTGNLGPVTLQYLNGYWLAPGVECPVFAEPVDAGADASDAGDAGDECPPAVPNNGATCAVPASETCAYPIGALCRTTFAQCLDGAWTSTAITSPARSHGTRARPMADWSMEATRATRATRAPRARAGLGGRRFVYGAHTALHVLAECLRW